MWHSTAKDGKLLATRKLPDGHGKGWCQRDGMQRSRALLERKEAVIDLAIGVLARDEEHHTVNSATWI